MSTIDPRAPWLIVILGPTASGKTDLAIEIAKAYNTEIISADSRQCYREISIGTAKPTTQQLSAVKHHFIDSHDLQESLNAGDFEQSALQVIDNLFKKNPVAVMAGGSGLYIRAVCDGFDHLPKADQALRASLDALYKQQGIEALQKELNTLDPEYFATIDQQNPHRLMRGIEVCRLTGQKYSELRRQEQTKRPFNILKLGLNPSRETLYQRINLRVDNMMEDGLLEEARRVLPWKDHQALQTVGYQELFKYFEDDWSLEEARNKIKQHTRNFAKRQLTWFRKESDILWMEQYNSKAVLQIIKDKITSSPI